MSEEKITSWQVLREDGHNCAWVNGRYIGTITDKQVEYLRKVGNMASCCFCKFGKVEDDSTITCRRFPSFISKAPDDWCGEFEAARRRVQADLANESANEVDPVANALRNLGDAIAPPSR